MFINKSVMIQDLKQKVEFVVNKYGYKTSYAENMLYAIDQVSRNDEYLYFDGGDSVIRRFKIFSVTTESGQIEELTWTLRELIGEYVLADNPNYFSESHERILKISTLPEEGWVDKDAVMLHAWFQLLVDFIEKEEGDKHCDYEAHKEFVDEIRFLYNWWKERVIS